MWGLYGNIACWLWELYMQGGGHDFSLIYIKYVHSAPCCTIDDGDLICGIFHTFLQLPYNAIKNLAYIPNLLGILVSGIYFGITCEVDTLTPTYIKNLNTKKFLD